MRDEEVENKEEEKENSENHDTTEHAVTYSL